MVVNPAIDSKKDSTGVIKPVRKKGIEPAQATPIQPRTTMRKTSWAEVYESLSRAKKNVATPSTIATRAVRTNDVKAPSLEKKEKMVGTSMSKPPAATTAPIALAMTLGCKEALYFIYSGFDGEYYGVVALLEHLIACGYDHVPVTQDCPDDSSLRETYL